MRTLLKNALVFRGGSFFRLDVALEDGRIAALAPELFAVSDDRVFDFQNCMIIPGLADVHVHLREPGFSYKETIATGTAAAAAGGYTDVCAMPNLSPAPDCPDNIYRQLEILERDACIRVHPYACITMGGTGRGELVNYGSMKALSVGFSDDGKGVQDQNRMLQAMKEIHKVGGIIAAHCEDESLLDGGYIHAGAYAEAHGHKGICSESEWGPIARDVELVRQTGCPYHVCHVSAKESVAVIRKAKAEGLPVSCETGPHYLAFSDEDLQEDGRFKMNPPIRGEQDRQALVEGLLDGTIDMIATDHAPHAAQEKEKGLAGSAMGIVGLETALPAVYTFLVKPGILTMEKLVELMCLNPRRRFGLELFELNEGAVADFTVFDPTVCSVVDPERFLSKGRATPFAGMKLYGEIRMTVCGGKTVYGGSRQ